MGRSCREAGKTRVKLVSRLFVGGFDFSDWDRFGRGKNAFCAGIFRRLCRPEEGGVGGTV
jgi:hypothetical protein